jgi:hypothetical protein
MSFNSNVNCRAFLKGRKARQYCTGGRQCKAAHSLAVEHSADPRALNDHKSTFMLVGGIIESPSARPQQQHSSRTSTQQQKQAISLGHGPSLLET